MPRKKASFFVDIFLFGFSSQNICSKYLPLFSGTLYSAKDDDDDDVLCIFLSTL